MKASRLRPAGVALAAVALSAVLTGCGGSAAGAAAKPGAGGTATASPDAVATATAPSSGATAKKPGTAPGAAATAAATPAGATPAGKTGAGPAGKTGAGPAGKADPGPAASGAPAADCAGKAPNPDDVDPDEFAVYRVEELDGATGKVNLVIQHGAWGCPGKDTDGAPFVVTGEESRWALDQAAYVTATNPVTDSSENRRIGVQELIDWIEAHPDSGLVFRYETGDDGAIHRLDEVFTP
ncbi:hypothetical protein [Streptomyces sp. NPDC096152]|uniref:hypothetical protein n=1 Tax=Streptomyces sp. NPDC096152 TaxID=3366078 RepID=UPI00381440E8